MLEMPSAALFLVVVGQGIVWFATTSMGIQQLLQAQIFISISAALCVLYALIGLLRGRLDKGEVAQETDSTKIVNSQLEHVWGRSLSKLRTMISLGEERIKLAQEELEQNLKGGNSSIYELIRIGYKCIQTSNAIHSLSARGFPDQALSLCRGLMEQEANLWFISTLENAEEVAQRYLDWESAKIYFDIEGRKDKLDKRNIGPTTEEWESLTKKYDALKVKYLRFGSLRSRDQWAVGTRANGTKQIEAFSIEKRVRLSMPWLTSDETQLHDAWLSEWQRLNEFTHTTPRSIFESASSNNRNVVVTGPSSVGIDEPITIAGRSILNISTILTNISGYKSGESKSQRSEDIGQKTVGAFRGMLEELGKVPEGARSKAYREQSLDQC